MRWTSPSSSKEKSLCGLINFCLIKHFRTEQNQMRVKWRKKIISRPERGDGVNFSATFDSLRLIKISMDMTMANNKNLFEERLVFYRCLSLVKHESYVSIVTHTRLLQKDILKLENYQHKLFHFIRILTPEEKVNIWEALKGYWTWALAPKYLIEAPVLTFLTKTVNILIGDYKSLFVSLAGLFHTISINLKLVDENNGS